MSDSVFPSEKFVLTKSFLCAALGCEMQGEDEEYSQINYANRVAENGVAIVNRNSVNPFNPSDPALCEKFADTAMQRGAKLLIAPMQIRDYPCIIYDNPPQAYVRIINAIRKQFPAIGIAVTGSIGKSTTTEMTYAVISSKYKAPVVRTDGSNNNAVRVIGLLVQKLAYDDEYYVQEVMEGPPVGCAGELGRMVLPSAAIITVVGSAHLLNFKTQDRIFESCLSIQEALPEDGLLIMNGDDPFQWGAETKRRKVYYAIDNEQADYRAVNIRPEDDCLAFDILHHGASTPVKIQCLGRHNVLNALAAFAAGKWAGLEDSEVAAGLLNYHPQGVRQNLVNYGGIRFYMDCYNSSKESVASAVSTVKTVKPAGSGRRIALLGDISESGDQKEEIHRSVGRFVAESGIDHLICYGSSAQMIAETARECSLLPVFASQDRNEVSEYVRRLVQPDDIVLVKGSRSMAMERVIDDAYGTWFHEEFEGHDFLTSYLEEGNVRYRMHTDHATAFRPTAQMTVLDLPSEINGLPVTGIAAYAFMSSELRFVSLPKTLRNIRRAAFYKCRKLETVLIPGSVQIIDRSAFHTCTCLRDVGILNGCEHLGEMAFQYCPKLSRIVIPPSVKYIADNAFAECGDLTIFGEESSYAERYAQEHDIRFVCT